MIIVNADDFGISELVNQAIVRCFEEGIISSTTIMANMPAFDNAVMLAKKSDLTGKIGFHFNLIEGKPLTEPIKSCPRLCRDGKVLSYKRNSVFLFSAKEKKAIIEEFSAQYEKILNAGIVPSHVDSHEHALTEIPVFLILKDKIKEYNIKKIRKSRTIGVSLKVQPYKFLINSLYKINGLYMTKYFTELDSQNVIMDEVEFMCHPTMDLANNTLVDALTGKCLIKKFNNLISYSEL